MPHLSLSAPPLPRHTDRHFRVKVTGKAGARPTPSPSFLCYPSFYEQVPVRSYFPEFSILLTFQHLDFNNSGHKQLKSYYQVRTSTYLRPAGHETPFHLGMPGLASVTVPEGRNGFYFVAQKEGQYLRVRERFSRKTETVIMKQAGSPGHKHFLALRPRPAISSGVQSRV